MRNEIRNDIWRLLFPGWGNGNPNTDWKLAATQAGNEVLKKNPGQLIIVEGLSYANQMTMIKDSPIKLDVPNKLIYSFHLYSWERMTSFDSY